VVFIISFTACTTPETAAETTTTETITTQAETTTAIETTTTQAETTTETMSSTSLESDKEGGEYPSPVGWVNDFASIFKQEDIDKMNEFLTDFEKKTTVEIAVVTISSLNGKSIKMYASGLFNAWGIGKKDINNGILFLVVPNDKQLCIHVGYGLENVITNVVASRIIDEIATPRFKKGEYGQGSYEVVKKLSEDILAATAPETTAPETTSAGTAPPETTAPDSATLSEKNAAKKALDYLAYTPFSYSGLVKQLEFEGYTHEEAVYGVDRCGADWNEQAAKKAEDYLSYSSFSRTELIAQLEFEGFTQQQAEYGVQAVGY
jgi:hypothetical protein